MTFEAIAFDLDGTLVDSAGGVALALNTALHEADLPCFDLQRVRGWIGNGPDVLIERALRAIDLQDIDTAWLSARVRRNFDAMVLGLPFAECSIYAGVEELLEQLGRKNAVGRDHQHADRARPGGAGGSRAARLFHHGARCRHGGASHAIAALDRAGCNGARNSSGAHVDDRGSASARQAACAAGCRAAWAGWGYGLLGSEQGDTVWRLDTPADLLVRMALPQTRRRGRPAA